MNSNAAWAADRWWLNLFPRTSEFLGNEGGYSTLNFIPTLATMLLGLIAGTRLSQTERHTVAAGRPQRLRWALVGRFGGCGALLLVAGWGLHYTGICPVIKKLWTPSWVLMSGGWCFLILAVFYVAGEILTARRLLFPWLVIGRNSLVMYVLAHTVVDFLSQALPRHLGHSVFQLAGPAYEPLLLGGAVLSLLWLTLWWMWQRRLFLRL
jgi:heparan-alpha-glucosaminide N-acetyltransferase